MLPGNAYVEIRNGGYYVAGSRIGLDVIVNEFRHGRIFAAYPSIGTLAKVYGAVAFILSFPGDVDTYLKDQDRIFDAIKGSIRCLRT